MAILSYKLKSTGEVVKVEVADKQCSAADGCLNITSTDTIPKKYYCGTRKHRGCPSRDYWECSVCGEVNQPDFIVCKCGFEK